MSYEAMKSQGSFGEQFHDGRTPEQRSREAEAKAMAWARANLPGEDPRFAACCALTLKLQRRQVTAAEVRGRLCAAGRDSASLARIAERERKIRNRIENTTAGETAPTTPARGGDDGDDRG